MLKSRRLILLASFLMTMLTSGLSDAINADDKVSLKSEDKIEDGKNLSKDVIFLQVPKKLNIKDKIFLVNHSQTTILQAVVAIVSDDTLTPIGNATLVSPGGRFEMASFSDNNLKKLKGQKIGIKIKGVKKILGDTNKTGIVGGSLATGPVGLGIEHREIKAEELNNIDPSLITYDYKVSLSEQNHDLYITVTSGSNTFDF